MRVAIGLARPMVLVVVFIWGEAFKPFVDICQQARLGIVYEDPGRDVHGGY